MENIFSVVVMAAITFPISFFLARGCLLGVVRLLSGTSRRHVLSSQP